MSEYLSADQKAEILEDNGYHYEESSYKTTKHRWYRRGIMVVASASYAGATKKAYEDYLDHIGEPAPIAAPVIEDVLAVKNAEIARLQAENARMKASIKEAYEALAPVRSVMESNITASAILQKALQAPAAPQAEAVTLSADAIDGLAKIQLKTAGHFAIVPMGSQIDRFIYDCEIDHCSKLSTAFDTPANRAAIAARRKELGLS